MSSLIRQVHFPQFLLLCINIWWTAGTLLAGGLCNTTCYDDTPALQERVRHIFREQVEWAVRGGAQFMICETISIFGEAKLALEAVKQYGQGIPCVMNMVPNRSHAAADDIPFPEALRRLEDGGAAVVGLNCGFGPQMMIPEITAVKNACEGPISCLPVTYRTTPEQPRWQNMKLPSGDKAYFDNMDYFYSTVDEMKDFGVQAKDLGVQFMGLCCGNSSRHFRALAESVGRRPPASKYSTDMSLHNETGCDEKLVLTKYSKILEELWA